MYVKYYSKIEINQLINNNNNNKNWLVACEI